VPSARPLSDLGNPKMAVFFSSLLPQSACIKSRSLAILGLVFCAMTFAWLLAYAIASRWPATSCAAGNLAHGRGHHRRCSGPLG